MQKELRKKDLTEFQEARKIKILDGIRLFENCSNKSNYEYTNDEIENIFADIEKSLYIRQKQNLRQIQSNNV